VISAQTYVVETFAATRLLALVSPTFMVHVRPHRALLFLLNLGSRHASYMTAQKLPASRLGIRIEQRYTVRLLGYRRAPINGAPASADAVRSMQVR
jgi:hypothetical protein